MLRPVLLLGALALATLTTFACQGEPKTSIVIVVSSQMTSPRALRSVRVVARTASGPIACETRVLGRGDATLPWTVEVSAPADTPLDVNVAGYGSDAPPPADPCAVDGTAPPRVARRARTRFVAGERLHLGMSLRQSCAGVRCGQDETCAAGECVSADRPPERLVEYSDALAFGATSFCFPTSVCFEDVTPVLPVDASDCTFQLPDEATHPDRLNVEILHDDFAREVLDLDPAEGFVRVADHPSRFRLAPALCRRFQARLIAALFTGADCPPKDALNPLCVEAPPDGGPRPDETLCTSPADLSPTPSAVYALMDRSRSMRAHLGSTPFKDVVDLALRAPALRTTSVGFRFLASDASQCAASTNAYATLTGPDAVPFGLASDVHDAIVRLVGDPARALPNDAPLFMDAALRAGGAVRALSSIADPRSRDRRYLLLIGNRDFASHCQPTIGDLPPLAFLAHRDLDVRTSTLLLHAPPETNQDGRDAFLDALTVARSGNAPFGDASFDDAAMRTAMAGFLGEVGACMYDLPADVAVPGDLGDVKISYFDVLASARVEVAYEPACGPGSSANGWNLDGARRVRLCGDACNKVRFIHQASAVYTLQRGFVPPEVPVKWSPPCAR